MVFLLIQVKEITGNVSKAATKWPANLWKLLDIYDDVNFAVILGT